jgi:carboxymethylenebutenolidase
MGEHIDYRVGDDLGFGYLARPPAGDGRGVLVLHSWWGLTAAMVEVADRLAGTGHVALAPDLWRGELPETTDVASRLCLALSAEKASLHLGAAVAALRARGVDGPLGVLGFGMGGALALFLAGERPDDVGAVISCYGLHPHIRPDLARLRAPVLGVVGADDPFATPDDARALQAALAARGGHMAVHVARTGHGFLEDLRPERFDPDAARAVWEATVAFLAARLPAPG